MLGAHLTLSFPRHVLPKRLANKLSVAASVLSRDSSLALRAAVLIVYSFAPALDYCVSRTVHFLGYSVFVI